MASSEAARKAWETRRAKLAAEGKAPSQSQKKAPAKSGRASIATLVRQPHIRPAGQQVYTKVDQASKSQLVQGYRVITDEYVKRHGKEPSGTGRWTIIIAGRHARYGTTCKSVEGPIECTWEELLQQIPTLAVKAQVAAGIVRVLP